MPHLKMSNVLERLAGKLPNTRFGRQYKFGIDEEGDYPYGGELLTEMSRVLSDIGSGLYSRRKEEFEEEVIKELKKEVDAFISTHLQIGMALDALIEALLREGRPTMADQVRDLRRLYDSAYGV